MLRFARHRATRVLALVAMAVFAVVPAEGANGCHCLCCGKAEAGPAAPQACSTGSKSAGKSCCCGTAEGGCCGQPAAVAKATSCCSGTHTALAVVHGQTPKPGLPCHCELRQAPQPINRTAEQSQTEEIADAPAHPGVATPWPSVGPSLSKLAGGIDFHPTGPPLRELYCVWRN